MFGEKKTHEIPMFCLPKSHETPPLEPSSFLPGPPLGHGPGEDVHWKHKRSTCVGHWKIEGLDGILW